MGCVFLQSRLMIVSNVGISILSFIGLKTEVHDVFDRLNIIPGPDVTVHCELCRRFIQCDHFIADTSASTNYLPFLYKS